MSIWKHEDVGHNQSATQELKKIFDGASYFDTPKPVSLIKRAIFLSTQDGDIVLDFFAGSGTTAHAVMDLNAEDGNSRKFITVQIQEPTNKKSTAYSDGFSSIADITKLRLRKVANIILTDSNQHTDIGFRVLKVDSSNMAEVYYNPDAVSQADLFAQVDNVKEDRTEEDLLFQVMLDWGVDLTLPIRRETIDGNTVFFVANNALVACFDKSCNITESFVKKLAEFEPMRLVFRDAGFASDSTKLNVEQVLKQLSPTTDVKSI